MALDEFGEVAGGLVVEGFVCDGEYFKIDSELYWEPMKVTEDRCNVVPGSGSGEEAGSRVLDVL